MSNAGYLVIKNKTAMAYSHRGRARINWDNICTNPYNTEFPAMFAFFLTQMQKIKTFTTDNEFFGRNEHMATFWCIATATAYPEDRLALDPCAALRLPLFGNLKETWT